MSTSRVAVRLPAELARDVDRLASDRGKFVLDAVRRELSRRRSDRLQRSLGRPHPDSRKAAKLGLSEWHRSPEEDPAELLDTAAGKAVRWTPNKGWIELRK